jgi:hypothetical protein
MAKARGLTRPITRKQALSYTRLTPNGLGVTAIASVNGRRTKRRKVKKNHRRPISDRRGMRRNAAAVVAAAAPAKANRRRAKKGSYAKRYAQTKKILRSNRGGRRARIHGIPPFMVGGQFPVIVPPAPKRRRRASRPKETVMKRKSTRGRRKSARSPAQRAAFKKMMAGLARYKKKSHPRRAKARKTTHRRSKGRRSPAQRAAFKKMLAGLARYKRKSPAKRKRGRKHYTSNKRSAKGRGGRVYSGYKSVTARVGKRRLPTYVFQSKKGKLKHIPLYAIAGAKSKAQVRRILSKGGKRAEQYRKRIGAINRQRQRASGRVALHGDIFTPNRKGIVVPYETWSDSMTPNRKRRRAKKSGRKASTHHKRRRSAARRPKAHRTRKASRRTAARKAAKTRALKHEMRSRAAKKAARTRKRRHGGGRKKAHRNRRRHHRMVPNRRRSHRRRHHRNRRHHAAAATPNRRRRHHRRVHRKNRRRSSYLPVRVARMHYASNRRRHRRHYRHNAGQFMTRIKEIFKVGALVALGFGLHRAATKILSDQVLAKVGFSTGPLATYRGLISGAIVAAAGIPLADKVFKKKAGEFNSGMFASLIHSLVTTVLNAAGQAPIAAALSAYPDAEGKAYHGMMGFGEYMPVSGFGAYEMAGFGASPVLSQAAAGFGGPLLSQAAAGFGDLATRTRYGGHQIAQAAAGFGAGPMITQAAAGTGEYLAQGVQGIGDYEMVSGVGGSVGATDEGIRPDLRSAERALNIAEAAAGVSLGDLPTASQLNPVMLAQPVEDAPEGMRAGILQGGDGIFG